MGKNILVISAVNFTTGGPYTILKKTLEATKRIENTIFIALVHSKSELINQYPWVHYIEYPNVKKSWLNRLYFEYVTCRRLSKELKATHWFCLHDMTANVITPKRFVYCHNPAPFYKNLTLKEIWLEPKFFLFYLFYTIIYRLNINKNNAVFVQQKWMRTAFEEKFGLKNVIVSRPENKSELIKNCSVTSYGKIKIFYPAIPRVFKNYDLLVKAANKLKFDRDIEFIFTISGKENSYAKKIYKLAKDLPNVKLLGYLSKEDVEKYYSECDVLCFPSKLETWGLPLSEAQLYNKWVFAANLPYAHEVLYGYNKKCFFNWNDDNSLVELIMQYKEKSLTANVETFEFNEQDEKMLVGFDALIKFILKE